MPNPNNNKAPATVGELVRLLFPCTDDCVRNRKELKKVDMYAPGGHMDPECDVAQYKARKILTALIEQLRITNHRYYEEEDERREGFNTAAEITNSKIDDILK